MFSAQRYDTQVTSMIASSRNRVQVLEDEVLNKKELLKSLKDELASAEKIYKQLIKSKGTESINDTSVAVTPIDIELKKMTIEIRAQKDRIAMLASEINRAIKTKAGLSKMIVSFDDTYYAEEK